MSYFQQIGNNNFEVQNFFDKRALTIKFFVVYYGIHWYIDNKY